MPQRTSCFIIVVVLACLSGCSEHPPTYLVHGMVVYPDGKPLTKGTVEFEAMDVKNPITAAAEISEDGTFQLGTFESNDGAIEGRHRVAVIADFEIGTKEERPELIPPPALHSKYREFKTSGLEFNVKPKKNNILVEVGYAPAKGSDEPDALDGVFAPEDGISIQPESTE